MMWPRAWRKVNWNAENESERMAKLTKLQKAALRLHTHIVVFKAGSEEERVAVMAQAGLTTNAIADKTGLTAHQVQYRILKAQREVGQHGVRFRQEFRNGDGLATLAVEAIAGAGRKRIQREVTPKFLAQAVTRINQ